MGPRGRAEHAREQGPVPIWNVRTKHVPLTSVGLPATIALYPCAGIPRCSRALSDGNTDMLTFCIANSVILRPLLSLPNDEVTRMKDAFAMLHKRYAHAAGHIAANSHIGHSERACPDRACYAQGAG